MPMLDANDPAFRKQYPNWAKVYDAWGRELRHVKACNPETGEVISYAMGWIVHAWYRLPVGKGPNGLYYIWRLHRPCPWVTMSPSELIAGEHELLTRHGFWPAPLRVVANRPEGEAETPS